LVPSCEPISTVTYSSDYDQNPHVTTLFHDYQDICKGSYITLKRALEVIPEAKVLNSPSPNFRFLVLPEGPPPANRCPCNRVRDWYQILRDNADIPGEQPDTRSKADKLSDICSSFTLDPCPNEGSIL
jgi:hypothetical protein